ncbi:serine/threonine-protein kinase [Sandaracinus amylolyticus]|uniref:serine/threonine-protein kinase n=1 Tax=Sandaracinus amylolyticus TaxID=927083 RepID=UPI001F01CAF1|nr:serine/threonine-protein kinase [Sandaracinus amylolyticus]
MLAVGTRLGAYDILAKLKAGGMATLFLARRSGAAGFRRHVAIKVVHEHLASDRAFVRMFVDEALLQARIHHPNVVHVEELGEQDGQHFLVMEYVHGCSLAQLMDGLARRARRLTPEMACNVAAQVLAGLHAAHELRDEQSALLGVVHRDVSPQNVLLAYEGHVKLIDFGVAKAKNRQSTVGGSLKGKLRYMAPEQAFGRPVDRRCDVYAIGIVLWEMLTMRKLFQAEEDLALLELVRHPKVDPPSTYAPEISPALDAVVMKALAPSAEDRFATAHDMRRAIAEALPGALMIDAANLAELLAAVMDATIERDLRQLPPSVSAVIENVERRDALGARGEEALKTMTISAAGIDYAPDEDAIERVSIPPTMVRTSPTPAMPQPAPARAPWIAIAAVVLALLVAIGVGAAVVMRPASDPEMTVTPLEPIGGDAPAATPTPVVTPVVVAPEPAIAVPTEPTAPTAEAVPEERPAPPREATTRPPTEPAPRRTRERPARRAPVPLADEF